MRSTHNRSVADADADELSLLLPTGMQVTWMPLGVVEKRKSVVAAAEQVAYLVSGNGKLIGFCFALIIYLLHS